MSRRFFLLFLFMFTAGLFAKEPAWVLLERGKAAYEMRNLNQSLDLVMDAVEFTDDFPEAEFWLGRIYAAQGQNVLAEEQYRRALDLSIYLRVPEDRYLMLYALADQLLNRGESRRGEAESLLNNIAQSEGYLQPDTIDLEHRYVNIVVEKGLDDLLYLYRDTLHQSLKAHRILGEMAWQDGQYRSALLHSTRTVLAELSTVAEAYQQSFPYWRFDIDSELDSQYPDRDVRYPEAADGVQYMLAGIAKQRPDLLTWLDESGFWPQIYLLSVSMYALGYNESAQDVWQLLAPEDPISGIPQPLQQAGRWGVLAASQLDEPFITIGTLDP